MDNTVPKRKDGCMDCESVAAATFKKARYSWQVKRSNREDISSVTDVVICDNVASCLHCNSRGDKSGCECNLKITSEQINKPGHGDVSEKDMECSVSNTQELVTLKPTSQNTCISNQSKFKSFDSSEPKITGGNNLIHVQNPIASSLISTSECFSNSHNFSRTSSPASSSVNFSLDGQDTNISEPPKDDGRTSVSNFSNTTSMLALQSNGSVDPEIEEESLLLSHRQREEELNLYLKRWQNQHIAKSIVDNAINKTLEEMGVSPEPQQFVSNLIENQGISEAIKLQGLIPQTHCSNLGPVDVLSDLAHSSNFLLQMSDQPRPSRSLEPTDNFNSNMSTTSSELLDHAVSVAIGTKGLTFYGPRT